MKRQLLIAQLAMLLEKRAAQDRLGRLALLVGALSIAGAVVLIVDMDSPFEGMIVVSACRRRWPI